MFPLLLTSGKANLWASLFRSLLLLQRLFEGSASFRSLFGWLVWLVRVFLFLIWYT
ncbi:hypothetical protein OIU77_016594 [Salix suchowensis]|uniref:Uncharacterized protein n=1 Tax=Salix suchowensis TaxID=1278906 RepID=A0ABQ8ZLF6_9ROSI|nr:hypothetical protein OIU77_016594 [Salix suchowensis]